MNGSRDLEGQVSLPTGQSRAPSDSDAILDSHAFAVLRNRVHDISKCLQSLYDCGPKRPKSGDQHHIDRSLNKYPQGYPHLAALMTADSDYLIVRQFNYLHVRVLLDLQDQLRVCEEKLERLDSECPRSSGANGPGSFHRKDLLKDIELKLKRYATFMSFVSRSCLQEKPSKTDLKNLKRYLRNNEPASDEKEKYYRCKEDLITLKPHEDTAGLDRLLSNLLYDEPNKLIQRIFGHAQGNRQDPNFIILSKWKLELIRKTVLLSILLVVLMGPLYPLYELCRREITALIIMGIMFVQALAVGLFVICFRFLARPKRQELIAYSVTYLAILAAFMSQTLQNANQGGYK